VGCFSLLIKIYPDKTNSLLYDEQADSYDSNPEAFKDLKKTGTPSPFSSTKAMLNDNEEVSSLSTLCSVIYVNRIL